MQMRTDFNNKKVKFGDEIIVIDFQINLSGVSLDFSDKIIFDESDLDNLGSKTAVIVVDCTGICSAWGQCFIMANDQHDLELVIRNINATGLNELKKWRKLISDMSEQCSSTITNILGEFEND